MRLLMPIAAVAFLVLSAAPGWPQGCPADARVASFAVWPPNSIPTGASVTGTHACGRKLTCIGGQFGQGRTRRCRWH